jgi:hypothetical protein
MDNGANLLLHHSAALGIEAWIDSPIEINKFFVM